MNIKQYLQQGYILNSRISDKKDELHNLRSISTSIASPIFGEASGSNKGNDKIGKMVSCIVDLAEEIIEQTTKLLLLKKEIMNLIESMETQEYKRILELRYIKYLKWEEIALEMDYSYRHVIKLHKLALGECQKIKDAPKCPYVL